MLKRICDRCKKEITGNYWIIDIYVEKDNTGRVSIKIYIAAKTSKEAKQMALSTWVAETVDNAFINVRVTRCWSAKETEYEGELDIFQINKLGLAWWSCEECEKEEFEILDNHTYKCKNCGKKFEIPYEV